MIKLIFELRRLDPDVADVADVDTKVLKQRINRWMLSTGYSWRKITTQQTQNTRYSQADIIDWVAHVNETIDSFDVPEDMSINMDETNLYFDCSGSYSWASRGSKEVSSRTTGSSHRSTVVLAVTLSGKKLDPMIIFKGTPGGRIEKEFTTPSLNYPRDQVYAVQEKAWMEERLMQVWAKKVLHKYTGERRVASSWMFALCMSALRFCRS